MQELAPAWRHFPIMGRAAQTVLMGLPQDDRVWRVHWIGVLKPHVLYEEATFEIGLRAENVGRGPTTRAIEVSAGCLGLLTLRSLWRGGQRVHTSTAQAHRLHLEVQPGLVSLLSAYGKENGVYAIPPTEYPISPRFKGSYLVLIRRPFADDEIGDIIIPCTELFRAYFATFGPVSYLLLTGCMIEPASKKLYNPDRSRLTGTHAHIHLGSHIKNDAAKQVARIAFDPVANDVAKRVVTDTIAAAHGNRSYNLVVQPPFRGTATWTVVGQSFATGNWKRFFVHQLLQCTAPFPFATYSSSRDNPGGAAMPSHPERKAYNGFVRYERPVPEGIIAVSNIGSPSAKSVPLQIVDAEDGLITPEIEHYATRNFDPERGSGSLTIISTQPATSYATGPSRRDGVHAAATFDFLDDGKGDETQPGTIAFFERVLDQLEMEGHRLGHTISVSRRTMLLEWRLNTTVSWAKIRTAAYWRPRRIVLGRIKLNGHDFTLFEIERRSPSRAQVTLGVRAHLDGSQLDIIFYILARGAGHFRDDLWSVYRLHPIARIDPVRHNKVKTSAAYAQRIIRHLLKYVEEPPGSQGVSNFADIA